MSDSAFQPPAGEVAATRLDALDWPTLERLRNDSHRLRAMGWLWLLTMLAHVAIALFVLSGREPWFVPLYPPMTLLLVPLLALGVYAAWARPAWGRPFGLALGTVMGPVAIITHSLLGFALAVIAVVSFWRGVGLFGRERITHRGVVRAYAARRPPTDADGA